jgi:hypothetical protein
MSLADAGLGNAGGPLALPYAWHTFQLQLILSCMETDSSAQLSLLWLSDVSQHALVEGEALQQPGMMACHCH